jgi:hypothetical protein
MCNECTYSGHHILGIRDRLVVLHWNLRVGESGFRILTSTLLFDVQPTPIWNSCNHSDRSTSDGQSPAASQQRIGCGGCASQ